LTVEPLADDSTRAFEVECELTAKKVPGLEAAEQEVGIGYGG
jgi:hypothetical protein